MAPEGAQWDSAPAVILESPAASVTYDLGAIIAVSGVYVQADANDTYRVSGSADGSTSSSL